MLTVRLFHGRRDLEETQDGWGLDGPTLGPFDEVRMTFGVLRAFEGDAEYEFARVEGFVHYDGVFYGDVEWSSEVRPFEAVREEALRVPATWRDRRAAPPVRVAEAQRDDFDAARAVFIDALRERCGDSTAEAAREALSHVVRQSGSSRGTLWS